MDKYVSDSELAQLDPYIPKEGRFLEIGTGNADSTTYISQTRPKLTLYTVDSYGFSGDMRVYSSFDEKRLIAHFKHLSNLANVIPVWHDSTTLHWELPLDGLFIDGGHYYETVKADYERFAPFVKKGCYIIFHDYWREDFGVKQVVEESGLEVVFKDRSAVCVQS